MFAFGTCAKNDAQLIAAAPDLLAACKVGLAVLEQDWEGDEPSLVCNQLRIAIARAEGNA
jgi:hypothetical protein